MSEMQIGLRGVEHMVVQSQDLASFMGNVGVEVLSTHRLVLLMEQASRKAIEESVPNGMMTVGTMINVRHSAATPLGQSVRAEAQLKGIEGRRLLFDVTAYDEFERVAEGEHERAVVSLEKFLSKIKEKSKSSY